MFCSATEFATQLLVHILLSSKKLTLKAVSHCPIIVSAQHAQRLSTANIIAYARRAVYRGCANLLARAAGRPVLPGAEVPYVD